MSSYTIYPVGDCCLTLTTGNEINEIFSEKVIAIQKWFNFHAFKGLKDVVVAYNSVSILYDPFIVRYSNPVEGTVSSFVGRQLVLAYEQSGTSQTNKKLVRIPVWYGGEAGPDLQSLAAFKQISGEEVVRQHTAHAYRVYMIGFLPGFPYMAAVPDAIAMARKPKPALIAAGSVGIAGIQTGIYPLQSPGGWQIIGRTPVKVFDPDSKTPFLLETGNEVQFYAISQEEFLRWNP